MLQLKPSSVSSLVKLFRTVSMPYVPGLRNVVPVFMNGGALPHVLVHTPFCSLFAPGMKTWTWML
jgi:hypothetical protein